MNKVTANELQSAISLTAGKTLTGEEFKHLLNLKLKKARITDDQFSKLRQSKVPYLRYPELGGGAPKDPEAAMERAAKDYGPLSKEEEALFKQAISKPDSVKLLDDGWAAYIVDSKVKV